MSDVFGTDASETINLLDGVSNGADSIWGFGGNDTIFGLGGADTIKGGGGADTIDGGNGIDTVDYTDSDTGVIVNLELGMGDRGTAEGDTFANVENVTGSAGDDTLIGNGEANVLRGYAGDDTLKGGGGADTLAGGNDDDFLIGGAGADTLNGGSGIDTASYVDSNERVFVSLLDDTASEGDAQGDELNGIENLTGGGGNDTLAGDHGANVLTGNGGNDWLEGWGGSDILFGGDGVDVLNGGDGTDTLHGGDGNDWLDGMAGVDTMRGEAGNDTYLVDSAGDSIIEAAGQGTDYVRTSISYALTANVENLATTNAAGLSAINLTGNGLNNDIRGNDGDNAINGGAGADIMIAYNGNDIYTVDNFGDVVVEWMGDGNDTVYANLNGYTLHNNVEILSLNAGVALAGTGNAQDNQIYGNALDNVLNGGAGADDLSGLGGNDSFSFVAGEAHGDIVWDFTGNGAGVGDLLRFEGYGTLAQGASLTSLGGDQYQVTSADGLSSEAITVYGAIDIAQDIVFV